MNAQRQRLIADGFAAGLIGYVLVVGFFVLLNMAAGHSPFYTASFIGEALFTGLRDPAGLTLAAGPILAFNGVHITAYLLLGFFAAWLVYEAELHPEFWYLALFFFIGAVLMSAAVVLAAVALLGDPVPTWSIFVASLLAALGMAGYLAGSHRALVRSINASQETRLGRVE